MWIPLDHFGAALYEGGRDCGIIIALDSYSKNAVSPAKALTYLEVDPIALSGAVSNQDYGSRSPVDLLSYLASDVIIIVTVHRTNEVSADEFNVNILIPLKQIEPFSLVNIVVVIRDENPTRQTYFPPNTSVQ
jgi:hypothetical protein